MKKKSAIIGALIITLVFIMLMGAVGVSAYTNTNGVAISNAPAVVSTSLTTGSTGSRQTTLSFGENGRTRHRESNEFSFLGVNE